MTDVTLVWEKDRHTAVHMHNCLDVNERFPLWMSLCYFINIHHVLVYRITLTQINIIIHQAFKMYTDLDQLTYFAIFIYKLIVYTATHLLKFV